MSRVPVVVVGGYLGAGKTTLVNHLLRHADGCRIAVLVNDFGAVGIDADLIVGAAGDVLALAGGCVCCSFGADLVGTLERVAARVPKPDVVLLECSGVGLPGAVARSAALARGVVVDGVALVVDAASVQQQARDPYVGDTVRQQLQQADLLVVNQADRVDAASRARLDPWLDTAAPGVPRVHCAHAQVAPGLVLGLRTGDDEAPGERAWIPQALTGAPAATRYRHFTHAVDQPVDPQALARELVARHPGLLRAKGLVTDPGGQARVLQVMGRRVCVDVAPDGVAATGLVVCIERRDDRA